MDFTTPIGRMVYFCLVSPRKNTYPTAQPKDPEYVISIALPKSNPGVIRLIADMEAKIIAYFGSLEKCPHKRIQGANSRIVDGDDAIFLGSEGYAGHWVLSSKYSGYAPPCVFDITGEKMDPKLVKSGDYGRITCSYSTHAGQFGKHAYLNLRGVMFIKEGEALAPNAPIRDMSVFSAPNPYDEPAAVVPAAVVPAAVVPAAGVPAAGVPTVLQVVKDNLVADGVVPVQFQDVPQ